MSKYHDATDWKFRRCVSPETVTARKERSSPYRFRHAHDAGGIPVGRMMPLPKPNDRILGHAVAPFETA